MTRPYKKGGVRKDEIIAAAQMLFFERGYDATPVEALLEQLQISKGAFYYYFKSKEELLDEMLTMMSAQIGEQLEVIVNDARLNVFEKLRKANDAGRNIKASNKELLKTYMKLIYRDENERLRMRMSRRIHETAKPFYKRIIEQGLAEKAFNTPSAEFAAEMVINMSVGLYDAIWKLFVDLDDHPENAQKLDRIVDLYEDACERLLGAPKGSLDIVKEKDFHAFRKKDVP
ncbi:MAG: TetR/AcrR family transcriptional regulator [Chitinispirillaceae bacterium]|nr:TetR/AcrR family transcriptional regulator [Chitinispirillaceae bacterium]